MEVIIYLCAVLLTALSIAVFLLIRTIRAELKKNRALNALLDANDCCTLVWSSDLKKISANSVLTELIGRPADRELIFSIFTNNNSASSDALTEKALAHGGVIHDFPLPDGNIKHIHWKSEVAAKGIILSVGTDITDETTIREKIKKEQEEGKTAEIPDRKVFLSEGTNFLKNCNQKDKIVILSIHIDRYQKISTLFGMDTADRLLEIYADGIRKTVSGGFVMGKMSVDNFALLMHADGNGDVEKFLGELRIYVDDCCNDEVLPAVLKEQSVFSAGACFYDGSDDIGTLFNKANMTLFTDSIAVNTICRYFDKTIEERLYNRDYIEQEIHRAIKNNEFELYYQPKISFQTKEILGAEALIRWNHPHNGLITPTSFIPIAEEVGLITQIDEWGLYEACRQNKLWQDKGCKPIRVSVNMSQAQLYQTDVISSIRDALEKTGLEPKYLEVELTETMAMQDIDRTINILEQIHEIGVSISMDDFGTGYSSLSSLKILPINLLKIDKSLIDDIDTNEAARSIVKAIVDLGKAMKLEVLAEGVETKEQFELLGDLSCDIAQGYYYGKPLPASEIENRFLMNED